MNKRDNYIMQITEMIYHDYKFNYNEYSLILCCLSQYSTMKLRKIYNWLKVWLFSNDTTIGKIIDTINRFAQK